MKKTYLDWLPCEDKGRYGIYDGAIEPTATGRSVRRHLRELREKAEAAGGGDEIWQLEFGCWYFGGDAIKRIDRDQD